jgi:hypothetical protein
MKLSIIHTSRGRPERAFKTALTWLKTSTDVDYLLGVELIEIQQYAPLIWVLQEQFGNRFHVRLFDGPRLDLSQIHEPNFVWPTEEETKRLLTANTKGNILAKEAKGDWIIAVADNLFPPDDWQIKMTPLMEKHKGEIAILGYPNQMSRALVSHPIVTRELLNEQGYLMYAGYYHTHGDNELFAKYKDCIYPLPFNIEHLHAYRGTAEIDALCSLNNSQGSYKQAGKIWEIRKKLYE